MSVYVSAVTGDTPHHHTTDKLIIFLTKSQLYTSVAHTLHYTVHYYIRECCQCITTDHLEERDNCIYYEASSLSSVDPPSSTGADT